MEKIIQSLLLENETVELPGLGVFKKRFRSSHIDADDTIHPPTSKPVFSIDKTARGKDLVGAIAVANNLSTEDAGIRLKEYVSSINTSLEEKGSYSFEGLGTLLKFSSGKIDFAPSKGSNFFLETLGFAAIRLPKQVIDINTQAKTEIERQPEIHEKAVSNRSETTVHDKVIESKKEPVPATVTSRVTPIQPEPPKKEVAPLKAQAVVESKPIEKKPPVKQAAPTPAVEKVEQAKENKIATPKETATVKEKSVVEPVKVSAKKVIEEPTKKRGLLKMLLPLFLLILAAWALFQFFGGTDETESNTEAAAVEESTPVLDGSKTIVADEKTSANETEPVAEKVVPEESSEESEAVREKPVEQKPRVKKQPTAVPAGSAALKKGYYIVVGAFGNSKNADKVINTLNSKGYEGTKITKGGLNQVGAYATEDMGVAKSLQSELKDLGYHDAWIMKR